ncbi:MAG: AAC(3) family N-acetyltransferase [Oscillospiraceae bacterium]|jgi:aminoglycoside 3-N-acetyltransferase|nr:AAC(3) family N-acetyltransferase [Oscillospiraceae bacterium]
MSIFRQQFYDLGICRGDVILMHSSMKSLGTTFTPMEFLLELMVAIGTEGTLLLPALTYEGVTAEKPIFDVTISEPCVGVLTKTFLHMDGVVRSMHPTHSVCAWGARAVELTSKHVLDNSPVGPNSPFMQLAEVGGKLLFLGDVLHACTFMHGIEEIVGAPYTLNKEQTVYTLIDKEGTAHEKMYFTHNFKGWEQEYGRIRNILTHPDIQTGKIGNADCTLIDANKLKSAATKKFKEDIHAFVSKIV